MRKVLLLAVASMSLVSFAQKKAEVKQPPTKEIIFGEGDVIDGDLSRPDVEYFGPGPGVRHQSLIKVREEFNAKVMESAREL